jgi:hypothetical protein
MKAAILSLLAIGMCGWTIEAEAADQAAWEKDFEQAKLTARRTGKPIFLTFR